MIAKVWIIRQLRIILLKNIASENDTLLWSTYSMLSNYFGKKQVLWGTFEEIGRIQIQIKFLTSFEPKDGAFNLKNKVSAREELLPCSYPVNT